MIGRVCVILALGAFVAAADPPPSQPFQPITKWNLDYGYTQCTALRTYGDAHNPVTLGIVQSPGGDTYELVVGREHSHSDYPQELQGSVDFGSGPISAWLLEYANTTGKLTLDQFRITSAQMAKARSAKSIVLHMQGADIAFALADIPSLLDAMQKCTSDLQNFWNFNDKSGRIAVPAKGSMRAIFTSDDYPKIAYLRSQEGTSQYLLMIDEKGSVAGCHIVRPSGVPILDAMGCAVIQKRTKLEPAKDSSGKPVRSSYVSPPIKWVMPTPGIYPTINR